MPEAAHRSTEEALKSFPLYPHRENLNDSCKRPQKGNMQSKQKDQQNTDRQKRILISAAANLCSLAALPPAAFVRLINPVFSGTPVKFQALLDVLIQLPSSSRTHKIAL